MSRLLIQGAAITQSNGTLRILAGATITVKDGDGDNVTLYTGKSTSEEVANPYTADSNGNYSFWTDRVAGLAVTITSGETSATYTVEQDAVPYDTVSELVASTETARGEGAVWEGGAERFTEASPAATDHYDTTAGGVKLYWDALSILSSPTRTEWVDPTPLLRKKRVSPTGFDYVPNHGIVCDGPGQARHGIDLAKQFESDFSADIKTNVYHVDPAGSDANDGSIDAKLATFNAANLKTDPGTIYIHPGTYTEQFLYTYTDNNDGTNGTPIRVIGLGPSGSVIFRAPGDQPSALTWSLDATFSSATYAATPSGGETVNAIIYKLETGVEQKIPHIATGADLSTADLGWHQISGTDEIHIKLGGLNVESNKADLEIMYSRGANTGIRGQRIYIENITFRGDNPFYVSYTSGKRPILYAKDCVWEYGEDMNFRTLGARVYLQNCISRYALNGDGFNYYDENTSSGQATEAMEIDCQSYSNGVPIWQLSGTTYLKPSRNWSGLRTSQGSSGHYQSVICRINGEYYDNFGQNIADTGASSKTWMIGSIVSDLYAELETSGSYGAYINLWMEGTTFMDCVRSTGVTASYGYYNQSGASKHLACEFSGNSADYALIAGSIGALDPANP